MRVEDLVPERFKAPHRAGMARYRGTGRGRYPEANKLLDLPAVAKSGKPIRVELSLSRVVAKDASGGPYVPAIVRDITERNRAEEFAAQLLGPLSGEPVEEPDAALADGSSEPRGSLGEARSVELMARELEVLRRLASGKTNRQIAREMPISLSSVKAYVARAMASSRGLRSHAGGGAGRGARFAPRATRRGRVKKE